MTNRDDFRAPIAREIAQRSGYRCSNPNCLRPTIGPDGDNKSASIGVAAHITAAAKGGPRYDDELSSEERSSATNGIWLCQTCSRLIDVDLSSHTKEKLFEWKALAEMRAYLGLRGFSVVVSRSFEKLEAKIPNLISEMRRDINKNPFIRVALVRWKKYSYNGTSQPSLVYYHEDHENLNGKLRIMENYGAIVDTSYGDTHRFEFTEDFVEFLEFPV